MGKNAAMVAWERETITNCPYSLDVALERFHTGDEERYGVLLHYGEERVTAALVGWFTFHNGRQTIEAACQGGEERLPDTTPEGPLPQWIGDPGRVCCFRRQLRPLGSRMAPPGLPWGSDALRPPPDECQADGAHRGQYFGLGDLAPPRLFVKVHGTECICRCGVSDPGFRGLPTGPATVQKLRFFDDMNGSAADCTIVALRHCLLSNLPYLNGWTK